MNTRRFTNWLENAIEEHNCDDDDNPILNVEDYVQAGVLTMDRGLVIRFDDRSEIHITIVQQRAGDDDEA